MPRSTLATRPPGSGPGSRRSTTAMLAVALLLSGCRTPAPMNQPVTTWDHDAAVETSGIASPERSGKILLAMTFSGGGTRAAAFAYGALQELAATPIELDGEPRRLLDEIDLISSVSGGSFTAAYYGLHGDGIFRDFEDVFLRKNVQRGLALQVLSPRYWLGLAGGDRSQLAARYYDRHIFHDARFADLHRPGAPYVVMNTTDLSTAGRFPFMPYMFGLLCSDLDSYPISHAVTASSAVPLIFPPIRLRNYTGQCDFERPAWLDAEPDPSDPFRTMVRSEIADGARTLAEREYLHLLDGGLSDNLGLANGVAALAVIGDRDDALVQLGHEDIELVLVITVNAEVATQRPWDRRDKGPTPVQVVSGLSNAQLGATNRMTLRLARESFSKLARDLSTDEKPVHYRHVEISFARHPDPDERDALRSMETSFNLSDRKVDRLIAAARKLVAESPELADALALLDPGRAKDASARD